MMNLLIDESSLFASHHVCKAAIIYALVRWIISWILKFVDSARASSSSSSDQISSQMICDSLELTTCGDLDAEATACAVCLNRMEEKDAVRRLRCCHVFHAECIDEWIAYDHEHVTCPLCRADLIGPNGVQFGVVNSESSWAVERMLYIFGEDDLPF